MGGHQEALSGQQHEILDPKSVEVRFGDPEKDAPRLLELFTQPTTIEHLANIRPYPKNKEEIEQREEEMREWYKNPDFVLLTAELPSGIIVATSTVEKKSPNVAEVGKLATAIQYRNIGVANKMLRAVNALIFSGEPGGLDCRFAEAFVIIGSPGESIPGYHTAINTFRRQGYEVGAAERVQTTRSWSNELGRLVDRNSIQMGLQRRKYIQDFKDAYITDFPKQRSLRAI